MSSIVIAGNTSGSVTLQAPAIAGTTTINLPTESGATLITTDASGNGVKFPDGTTQMTAGASTGKAIAMAIVFG